MKEEHLKAITWLRWRLLANSLRRSGKANAAFAGLLLVLAIALAVGLFSASLSLGINYLPEATPEQLLFLWGILVIAYAISWIVGMNLTLQRSAPLSLDKLLHLPVSPIGAFLCNFVGSFTSLANVLFVPVLLGVSLGLIATKGTSQLPAIPLTLSLVFMVTTLAYQLQEWLAFVLTSKRTKTAVRAFLVITFLVIFYAPGFIGLLNKRDINDLNKARWAEIADLKTQQDQGRLNEAEFAEQRDRLTQTYEDTVKANKQAQADAWTHRARIASAIVPIGWVPTGIVQAAEGRRWPAWAGMAGMLIIGGCSLRRSYRQVLIHHTGQRTTSQSRNFAASRPIGKPGRRKRSLVEYSLPGLPERCSVIVMTTFRLLLRTPEVKLVLLGPVFLLLAAVGLFYLANDITSRLGESLEPMFALGVMCVGGFTVLILVENQFSFDGQGLRSYLLVPVARHEILLGKNLAMAPVGLGLGALVLGVVHNAVSLQFSVLIASLLQYVTICAALCLIGNSVAILFPADRTKSKFAQARTEIVTQFLVPVLIAPFAVLPVYFPFGLAFICRRFSWADGIPVYLIASALTLGLALFAYWRILLRQGELLQKHETTILNTITAKAG